MSGRKRKLRTEWSHNFTSQIDATLWVAVGYGLSDTHPLTATVAAVGTFAPVGLSHQLWAEYGARAAMPSRNNVSVDAFMDGVSGSNAVRTAVHAVSTFRVRF